MNKKIVAGIDLGGTKCAAVLAEVGGGVRILGKRRFPTAEEPSPQRTMERLFMGIREMLLENGLGVDDLAGAGISCGGPLDSERGVVLSPPNLPGWDAVPVAQMAEKALGAPAFLQNDANACALVEWKLGAGRGVDDLVFCTMGTGFGAGIVSGGRLLEGACGMAGEIGHVRLEAEGPVGYGKAGSVEGFCSGAGMQRAFSAYTAQRVAEGKPPAWAEEVPPTGADAALVGEYARRGDPEAVALFRQVGSMLGRALSVLIDVLNPAVIALGGVFARQEPLLRDAMEAEIRREALAPSAAACRIVPAGTGEQIGDLAGVLTACYGLGIDPLEANAPFPSGVSRHYERLFARYPALSPLRGTVKEAYKVLCRSFAAGGKLLVCGNGGSAADAEHIVGELMKGFYLKRPLPAGLRARLGQMGGLLQSALPAVALTGHTALSTAFANDVDPALCFAQQVLGYGRKGDVLLCISTSGNSGNVCRAAEVAAAMGLAVVSLTGRGGGALKDLSDVCLMAPADVTAEIQELHLPLYHTLCAMLEAYFFGTVK